MNLSTAAISAAAFAARFVLLGTQSGRGGVVDDGAETQRRRTNGDADAGKNLTGVLLPWVAGRHAVEDTRHSDAGGDGADDVEVEMTVSIS